MSNKVTVERIQSSPKYHELIRSRDSLAITLTIVVLVVYFGFVLMTAFAPDFLTQKISSGSVIPVGIPIGVGVILISIVLTAIYVSKANNTFDPINEQIIREATK